MRRSEPPAPDRVLRGAVAGVLALVALAGLAHGLGLDAHAVLPWLPGCPFRALTGWPCPGCGMTRALLALGQLRLADAVAAHPLAPALLVAMIAFLARRPRRRLAVRAPLPQLGLALVVVVWGVRLANDLVPD